MPGKNIIKQYAAESFYHVYSRGVNKQPIFLTDKDYVVFISLLKRYLSTEPSSNASRHAYPSFSKSITLLAYALMPNHIHLLLYQEDERAMTNFMRSLLTGYSMYFNKTCKRVGPVFQSRYKASLISTDSYLEHISRYIHMNPAKWRVSDRTSLRYYLGNAEADWIKPEKIMEIFHNNPQEYLAFLEDYSGQKEMLEEIKWELAHDDNTY
jgi:putative transposase